MKWETEIMLDCFRLERDYQGTGLLLRNLNSVTIVGI